jgi:hypothetical protein
MEPVKDNYFSELNSWCLSINDLFDGIVPYSLPDLYVVKKILSWEYQLYVCGKIFYTLDLEQKSTFMDRYLLSCNLTEAVLIIFI